MNAGACRRGRDGGGVVVSLACAACSRFGPRADGRFVSHLNSEDISMGFTAFENTAMLDAHTVSFDKPPQAADKVNVVKRISKKWEGVVNDLNGLGGLKLGKPDFDALADALIKSGKHAVIFEVVLTKAEFRLDVIVADTTWKAGSVKVPTELEDYRNFLGLLNGWSDTDKNIVSNADFKKWNDSNPKKPAKPSYKDFDEMAKKSKADVDAFRAWAKGNGKAKEAFKAIDATAKAKATDPAREKATTAINAALQDYYKTF
jgi:hypothetical protein